MAKPTVFKVALVPIAIAILLGICFTAASYQRSARAMPAGDPPGPIVTKVEEIAQPPAGGQLPLGDTTKTVASGGMRTVRAQMTPQGLHVVAQADIYDRRPASRFFWGCRVYPSGRGQPCIFEKVYNDRMFGLPETGSLAAKFEDVFVFPAEAGRYKVEVIVFTIPPGMDLSKFRDAEYEQTYRFVRGSSSVVIR